MRGASFVSHSGCSETVTCISRKRRSGSFCTLTSTLNLTCWFSGWESWLIRECTYAVSCSRLTFISSATVSANVGMGCLGAFLVRRCCIPSSPCQFRSRIKPGLHWSLVKRGPMAREIPFESVVLSRASFRARCHVLPKKVKKIIGCCSPGSWNITTTPSAETWTSETRVTGKTTKEGD